MGKNSELLHTALQGLIVASMLLGLYQWGTISNPTASNLTCFFPTVICTTLWLLTTLFSYLLIQLPQLELLEIVPVLAIIASIAIMIYSTKLLDPNVRSSLTAFAGTIFGFGSRMLMEKNK